MIPYALLEKRAWAREFEVEGLRITGAGKSGNRKKGVLGRAFHQYWEEMTNVVRSKRMIDRH